MDPDDQGLSGERRPGDADTGDGGGAGVMSLASLVAAVSPENRHEETCWGEPVGAEEW